MTPEQFDASFPTPLLDVFRQWLHTGWVDLGCAMGADSASPPVYKTFGQFVAAHAVQSPGWERIPVAEFLGQPAAQGGSVRDVLRGWLPTTVNWLLHTAVELVEWHTYDHAMSPERFEPRRKTRRLRGVSQTIMSDSANWR